MNEQPDNWMPLESNPEVINSYIDKMGLKTQLYNFQEMLSIEDWALDMIPQPVLGIILLYECTPVQNQFKNQQAETLNPADIPANVFYMKQIAHNACGTIALFHTIINALENYPDIVKPDSYIVKFKNDANEKDPNERGTLFEKNEEIKSEHKGASQQGQSAVQASVDSHFIAFIQKNGNLYELDGLKKCAVNHGPCQAEEILVKGSQEIKKFMQRDPDNINFSMIVLAKNNQ